MAKELSIFVGFRHEGKVIGSTWRPYEHEYPERRAKVLEMVEHSNIQLARDIYNHIEWKPFDGRIQIGDGIHLIDLFKRGVDGYVKNTREILKFLCKKHPRRIEAEMAEKVQYLDGKVMIPLKESTHIFNNGEFDKAFIFDLDASRVEVIENRPIPVS
ncbi:hypothetical protein [Alicyclobacillus mengziensis]|uniref:Uncharacterized protein n=1 Tax=Alicyclobacillus mengziensis TaxID=2931921 RepID=A0A9X7W0W9_9BACL|nr:hypothetical protein [Alicyclobacillus mengziensis]QSO48355.1 hypothetical protein JZ786_05035 [Alicyclobacillus mengziensis]